jgi:hypothetical protein
MQSRKMRRAERNEHKSGAKNSAVRIHASSGILICHESHLLALMDCWTMSILSYEDGAVLCGTGQKWEQSVTLLTTARGEPI